MMQTDTKLITIAEASVYMRISQTTIRKHLKDGKINSLRAGKKILFTKEEIDRFLDPKIEEKEAAHGQSL